MNHQLPFASTMSMAHFLPPGLPAWQTVIESVSTESSALSHRLAALLDEVDCGLLLLAGDKTVYANRAARLAMHAGVGDTGDQQRLVPMAPGIDHTDFDKPAWARWDDNGTPCAIAMVPLGRQADSSWELTLVMLGTRCLCDDLSSRFNTILHEVEQCLIGVRNFAEPDRTLTTMLFTDIVESTQRAERLGDEHWHRLLEQHHAIVRSNLSTFRGREIDAAGDGFFATFDAPARAIRCAQAIRAAVRGIGLEIRAGLHTGECEVVGNKVIGVAVHVAARVAATATAGEILVSSTVRELVAGSGLRFSGSALHTLKGLHKKWRLFSLSDGGA